MSRIERIAKRAIDVTTSFAALAALVPLFATVAVAIKLDSRGPIFFRQERLGLDGRRFRIWKFRTMRHGASVVVDERGNVVNTADDARHTRVGVFLRRTSIDELPQLLNVLRGEMSLVGPRPDLPQALGLYSERERVKLSVKPGITGLSQASGRNALDAHHKWELDARYAEATSLASDLRIIARTLGIVLGRKDIYAERRPSERGGHGEG